MLKMFINNVNKKEEIKSIALRNLRKYGIKHRIKATRHPVQVTKSKKLFKVPLQNLENETITLKNGLQLVIPKRLFEMCSYILTKVDTEGIFRKEGSRSRQNEIKLSLDRGCSLGIEHHVIDVSVVLKSFLRELPEPLIPYAYHELFLRCSLVEHKADAILLACLLLPNEHINVLSFVMQFLDEVSSHAKHNKMDAYNLAVLIGPNIFPINEKCVPKNKLMFKKICDIVKLMIENAKHIGVIPDDIIEQIGNLKNGETVVPERTKRRRSRSLTRIFNGLKKIVSNRTEDEVTAVNTVTPDLLLTPLNYSHSVKRRENLRTRDDERTAPVKKTVLERRWSAITTATNSLRRKKRDSLIYHLKSDSNLGCSSTSNSFANINSSTEGEYVKLIDHDINKVSIQNPPAKSPVTNKIVNTTPDYVKVPKTEYEEIKNRVSEIEKRLSKELDTVSKSTIIHNKVNIINDIQSAYEKTLNVVQDLSPGTDQLARRLSKELRIRTSDQKTIRSPSARKIGNIRRRSKEFEKPSASSYGSSNSLLNSDPSKSAKRSQSLKRASPLTSHLPRSISSPKDGSYKIQTPLTRSISLPRSNLWKAATAPCSESSRKTPLLARTLSTNSPVTNRIVTNSKIDVEPHITVPSPSLAGSSFEQSYDSLSPGFRNKNCANVIKSFGRLENTISPRSKVIRSRVGIVKRYSNLHQNTRGRCVNRLKRRFEEGSFNISDEENIEIEKVSIHRSKVNTVNITPHGSSNRASDESDEDAVSKLPQFKRALPVVRTPKRVYSSCTPKGSRLATPLKCLPGNRMLSDV
ncbi:unnamed protein product [Acanthoscelides obtectus]|uniref:Rho-GAP domain-containing protein n=1 Tax=Acanthoscelides obtectus TaxID=200917 RepID=A0A9P0L9F2_ACAOB|nr:unnamed protein product [Acanthoscelides obtectus]CAK1673319.1 Rho GTPase-activating protein 11A [Acanthoscelides obtectus]